MLPNLIFLHFGGGPRRSACACSAVRYAAHRPRRFAVSAQDHVHLVRRLVVGEGDADPFADGLAVDLDG